MRYWIVKGNPRVNDLDEMLAPGRRARWVTRKPPRDWAAGDFLFFWKSAPVLAIAGIGRLDEPEERDDDGVAHFNLEYLSRPLVVKVGIADLRADATLCDASFLKAGAAGTVFPLSPDHARRLARIVKRANESTLSKDEREHLEAVAATRTGEEVDRAKVPQVAQPVPQLKGLVVRRPFVDWIVDGKKTWEMRSTSTKVRGTIALIAGGTGTVVGTVELVDALGPLDAHELRLNAKKLNCNAANVADGHGGFAWVLRNARRLLQPVPYKHPSGAVIWVNLAPRVSQQVFRTGHC